MKFSTLTDPMPHQMPGVAKLLPSRVGGLLADMGTGKSRMLIELAKLRAGRFDRLIWLCPVAGKESIRQQLRIHTDLPDHAIYLWDAKTSERNLPSSALIHIIGIETLSSSDRAVLAYNALVTPESFVAVDESQYIKGHRSKRTLRITHMSARCRYRAVLSGTVLTQGPVDLYAQMNFLSPKILGYRSFWSFAANHLEYEQRTGSDGIKRRTGRIVESHNLDYLAAKIAPYVFQVRKDECLDLPDKLYETRYCSMGQEQRNYYEQAKAEILLELDYDDWSSIKIFHLFSALQSIVCGFWNRTDPRTGEQRLIDIGHSRIALLMAVIAEIPPTEQVIIWAKYHYCIRQITEALSATYGADQVNQFHGELEPLARSAQLNNWRSGSRFLIATQDTGGQVHTFNEAAYVIFYADGFKYSQRIQAEDRNHRIGQLRRPVYVTLQCSQSIDDRIAAAIAHKGNALLEFQESVNNYRHTRLRDRAMKLVRNL